MSKSRFSDIPPMLSNERSVAVLCHLSTIVPIWGIVVNAILLFGFRERSRVVCLHARQGIGYQVVLLLLAIAWILGEIFLGILSVAGTGGDILERTQSYIWIAVICVYGAYSAICLTGAVQAFRGRIFAYPFIGTRIYAQYAERLGGGK
jgi:uncharacterized Tic20 family protein